MSTRTTSSVVEALLMTDYDGTTSLTGFIEVASSFVDDVVACAARKGLTLSASKLEILERLLAAHFYMMSDQGLTQKSTGSTSGTFQGRTDLGIDGTKHGQNAKMLDPTGCVVALAMGKRASGFWNGKVPSQQIPYIERD